MTGVWLRWSRLPVCLALLPCMAFSQASFQKSWYWIGPFASGKGEQEADPLETYGGARAAFAQRKKLRALSEYVEGGYLKWQRLEAGSRGEVLLPDGHVNWQFLTQSLSDLDVQHAQYWTVGAINVKSDGTYLVDCAGVHTLEVDDDIILAGNIYSSPRFGGAPVDLTPGKHYVYIRVRGKRPLQFQCSVRAATGSPLIVEVGETPDVVAGALLGTRPVVEVQVRNARTTWANVTIEIVPETGEKILVHGKSSVVLAPGLLAQVPVVIRLSALAGAAATGEREGNSCARFRVSAQDSAGVLVGGASGSLRCRLSSQSSLFTYVDHDGSLGSAGVLKPRKASRVGLPILVTFSGVGVGPQQQADAYKWKPKPSDKDYTFGYENMWVLAPQRSGPHNWEDTGIRTAMQAIDVLAEATGADNASLIVHGHSRGGHGAWGLATRIPDRVLGVMSACGWYSREEYGDANNLWIHEASLMYMDKMLQGILHASIAENDNNLHASNLAGMPAHVRVATRDQAVPPWLGRRMARHLREEGALLSFDELNHPHWWWDSAKTNDGGALHDALMRNWTASLSPRACPTAFTIAATGPEYEGRCGLRVEQRHNPTKRAFLHVNTSGDIVRVRTVNARRVSARPGQLSFSAGLLVDGVAITGMPTSSLEPVHICSDSSLGWTLCSSGGEHLPSDARCSALPSSSATTCQVPPERLGTSLGPMRRVFARPWVVVIPDSPSSIEMQLAVYFATGHFIAVHTHTQVLKYSDALDVAPFVNRVLLGSPAAWPSALWPVRLSTPTCSGCTVAFELGPCRFDEPGYGVAFIAPRSDVPGSADLVITATTEDALRRLISFSYATNQPHTRAPLSNMLPDYAVIGPHFGRMGYGGYVALGYWGADWSWRADASYMNC